MGVRSAALVTALLLSAGWPGWAAEPTSNPAPSMVNTSGNPRTLAAPVAGANSYTRGEAEARMNAKGFVQVSNLRQDERGIWRGAAMKDGHRVEVALDYQGNVVAD